MGELPGLLQGRDLRRDYDRNLGPPARSGGTDGRARRLCGRAPLRHRALPLPPLVLDDRQLLLPAGPVRRRKRTPSGSRTRVDRGGGRTRAPRGCEPRLLAHPREQCGRPSALRQAGGALGLHPISQAFLTRFAGPEMTIALTAPTGPTRRLFLGVERSACGRAWRDRLDERGAARALAIAQRHQDVPELLARILAGRGVEVDEVASLLVTVDCGTTSYEPLLEARQLGLEVIVIDHHQADERLPAALAVVNPNRLDDLSTLGHLAAVGLVFMTVVAVNRELRARGFWTPERPEPDLLGFLDLVALGTVADVVPLKGLNRAFVAKGLLALRRRDNAGLTALMDVARLGGPPEPWHLGFLLGPRINAGGRIGRATLGVDLLMQDDVSECARLAAELDRLNRERQAIELATLAQAEGEAMAALGVEEKGAVVVTAADGWHPGVVGLVAARLKERFGRPAFAIALEPGGIGTGSGRSIAGVDLGRAVRP